MNIYDPRYKQIENLPNEIWKDVPKFEDAYEVSSEGRVRSKDRYIVAIDDKVMYVPAKILTPTKVTSKCRMFPCYGVTLASNGTDKHHYCRSIKVLVANAFFEISDKHNLHLVTIDDPEDFSVDNLLYVTYQEFKDLCN